MKLRGILIGIFIVATATMNAQTKVKNVIFMIGDGMGLSQVYAAQTQKGDLTLLQLPYTGLIRTCSSNNYITDSAAAGTALSSGVKTKNGMLGCNSDTIHTESIMELAKRNGLSTGIGVTCSITHATPAAYYAHQPNREMHEEIAQDLLYSDIDICIGGGKQFFDKRKDGKDLIKEFEKKGYQVVVNQSQLNKVQDKKVIALLSEEHLPKISENRGDILPESTALILSLLNKDNKKGFFVMIEGSQIDWGAHANDQQYAIDETIDFDNAVKQAYDFAKKDGNTLLIVTADHETGGMTLVGGNIERKEVNAKFSTENHTATPVPVYAFGPGAENFTGYFDNIEFKDKITKLLNIQ